MKLEPGEYVCDNCEGTGKLPVNINRQSFPCWRCGGDGKIDWVTNAMHEDPTTRIYRSLRIPKIRRAFPKLLAEELCSVQPVDFKVKKGNKE